MFSSLPSSFAPFIISLCLQSRAGSSSNVLECILSCPVLPCLALPCRALSCLAKPASCPVFPLRGSFSLFVLFYFWWIKNPFSCIIESSPHPYTLTLTSLLNKSSECLGIIWLSKWFNDSLKMAMACLVPELTRVFERTNDSLKIKPLVSFMNEIGIFFFYKAVWLSELYKDSVIKSVLFFLFVNEQKNVSEYFKWLPHDESYLSSSTVGTV